MEPNISKALKGSTSSYLKTESSWKKNTTRLKDIIHHYLENDTGSVVIAINEGSNSTDWLTWMKVIRMASA